MLYRQRFADERHGWEVRHGVLLIWKYVCALARIHCAFGRSGSSSLDAKHPLKGPDEGHHKSRARGQGPTSANHSVEFLPYDYTVSNSILKPDFETDFEKSVTLCHNCFSLVISLDNRRTVRRKFVRIFKLKNSNFHALKKNSIIGRLPAVCSTIVMNSATQTTTDQGV